MVNLKTNAATYFFWFWLALKIYAPRAGHMHHLHYTVVDQIAAPFWGTQY